MASIVSAIWRTNSARCASGSSSVCAEWTRQNLTPDPLKYLDAHPIPKWQRLLNTEKLTEYILPYDRSPCSRWPGIGHTGPSPHRYVSCGLIGARVSKYLQRRRPSDVLLKLLRIGNPPFLGPRPLGPCLVPRSGSSSSGGGSTIRISVSASVSLVPITRAVGDCRPSVNLRDVACSVPRRSCCRATLLEHRVPLHSTT